MLHGEMEVLGFRFGRAAYLTDFSKIPDSSMALLEGLDELVLTTNGSQLAAAAERLFASGVRRVNVSLDSARIAVDTVLKAARPTEPLSVAIVDGSGHMVYQVRQDGASAVDVRNAERKAYTAAFIGRDTALWRLQIVHDGRTVSDWANPSLTTIHGGWTLRRASQVIANTAPAPSPVAVQPSTMSATGC